MVVLFCKIGHYILTKGMKRNVHKDIFACLFSIHNIISLSCHEQVSN